MRGETLSEKQRAILQANHWKPGQSGNPGGKPVRARNHLQASFLTELARDFDANGAEAIKRCREEDPAAYVRAIVALMPKELEISRPLDDLTDEQLEAAYIAARALAAAQDSGAGEGEQEGVQPAAGLPAVPEAG